MGPHVHSVLDGVVVTCWGVVVFVWVTGTLYNAFRGPHTRTSPRLFSNLWTSLVVAALAWIAVTLFPGPNWHWPMVGTPWIRVLGSVLLVGSTVFTLWARVALGTMWSSLPRVKVQHQLRTNGPYGVTRHPIYTGLLGMLLGTIPLVGPGPWVLALPVAVVLFELRIHSEEALMLETFPEAYLRYRRDVPQLMPGLRLLHRRAAHT